MKYLESLRLHNIVLFKDAVLPLNHKGVTKIQGYNKDADKRNSEDNTNAAGKSLLTSCIAQLVVGSDAVTQDLKVRAKKDFFSEKDSSMELTFRVSERGETHSIEKRAKGGSFQYVLKKEGEELNTRTLAYAEQKIRELFPYTEDEFYTLYYIDSRKPNSLQFGSPVQRLDFLTNIFRLHDYDEVRKLFNGLLASLKKDVIVLQEIEGNLDTVVKEIGDDMDTKALEAKYEESKTKQSEINDEIHELYEVVRLGSLVSSNKKTMQKFNTLASELGFVGEYHDEDSLRKHSKSVDATIKELASLEKQAAKYTDYLAKREHYDEQYQALQSKLAKVKGAFTEKQAKRHEENVELEKELRDKIKLLEKTTGTSDFDLALFETYSKQFESKYGKATEVSVNKVLTKYLTDKSLEERFIRDKQSSIDKLIKLKDCPECPTCNRTVEKKMLSEWIEEGKNSIATAKDKAKALQVKIEKVKSFLSLLAKHSTYLEAQEDQKKLNQLRLEIESVENQVKEGEEKYAAYQKSVKYREQLGFLVPPKEVEKPSGDYSRLPKLREWQQIYSVVSPIFDKYHEAPEDIEDKAAEAEQRMEYLKKKASKYMELTIQTSSRLEVLKSNKRRLKALKTRHSELSGRTCDIPVVEMLIEAYSNKGVKLLIIKQIASIVEKNMNKFAPLLYKERIKFTFDVDVNKFDILMERSYRGKTRVSDVRRLSGAESRAFSFLLPLALLPLIPLERRLNIMVLDEPTVNLDHSMTTLFTESFIPKLNSIIPSVIVVSPLNDNYKNQKTYTVVKENGFSTLVTT